MSANIEVDALTRAAECWNAGDLEGYLRLYSTDAELHGYAGVEPGIAGIRKYYQGRWAAFPGSRLTFEDLFASGDRVACRFVIKGTNSGPLQDMPPTGKSFVLPGISILRFAGDKCVERWSQTNSLGLLHQLGALPARGWPVTPTH